MQIPKTMLAAVYRGANDLQIETVPVPCIGRNELLVKVAACGVCPTDIKKIQYGTVPPPRIFGHETAGTVVKVGGRSASAALRRDVGSRVEGFRVGDRVALHHHVPCMECHYCRHHAFAQCAQYKQTGITAGFEPAGGGFAEYVRVMPFVLPGVVKIPAKNSFEEGAMLEPVNTVLKAVKRLGLLPGDNVLVAGQGPIGLMFTRLLQLRGMNVLATDLLESRLRLAKRFGAKWTKLVQSSKFKVQSRRLEPGSSRRELGSVSILPEELKFDRSRRRDQSGLTSAATVQGFDAAVLAVPSDDALQQALKLVRGAGKILLFAHTKRPGVQSSKFKVQSLQSDYFPVDLSSICVDEKDLLGSYSADFTLQREVARLVFSRKLEVRELITHRFPLEKTSDAVQLAARPTPESLKVIVGCQ